MDNRDIELAAERGARRVLKELGLDDEHARDDLRELRDWVSAFRLWKQTAMQTTARIFTVAFWGVLMLGFVHWVMKKLGNG